MLLAVARSQAARLPTSAATSLQASKAPKGGDGASAFRRDHFARGPGDGRRASAVFRMDWCPTGDGDGSHVPPEQRPTAMDTTASQEVQRLRAQIKRLEAQLASHALHDGAVEPFCRTYGRTAVSTILSAEDGGLSLVGRTIRVGGWVRNGREAGGGKFAFIELYDGSCFASLQCMVDGESTEMPVSLRELTFTGNALLIEGCLARTPPNTKQKVELKATRIVHYGKSDPTTYSLAGKKISMEFLREKAHLRSRTNIIGVVARIRNALSFATHKFFQAAGFKYVHTPIITASDCEGAGEMFQVSTLLGQVEEEEAKPRMDSDAMKSLEGAIADQGAVVRQAKEEAAADKQDAALKATVKAETEKLKQMKAELSEAQDRLRFVGGLPRAADGKIDYSQDFFGRPAYLTVSGQLNGEYTACALSSIYTFGPTFRAENSHTARHLAEFWMIEPELAFADLHDDMLCAEHYVQCCCQYLLENCMPDLEFLRLRVDKTCIDRLRQVAYTPFKRISYTSAVEVLEEAVKAKKKKFEFPVKWGVDLSSEHERYLTEEVFKQPLIVYDYPKDIKAFYMRLNDDQATVAAMDVLVPKVGELVGGSQREDRLDVLERRILDAGMDLEPYSGYLDLRRYGSVPHAGFGLGFERLIMFATGIENIRDVIPFPRWPGNAAY